MTACSGTYGGRELFCSPSPSQLRSDLCQVPCSLVQMIPGLGLKAASTEMHRNGDMLPEENTRLRNSQHRQRCPLTRGHFQMKSLLSRLKGDRCFKIPVALIVQCFVD